MALDRVLRDHQRLGHLAVAQPLAQQLQHLALALGQGSQRTGRRRRGQRTVHQPQKRLAVEIALLQIAHNRAPLERLVHIRGPGGPADNDGRDAGPVGAFQQTQAVGVVKGRNRAGQCQVDHRQRVGVVAQHAQRLAIAATGVYLEIALAQQLRQNAAPAGVVLHQQRQPRAVTSWQRIAAGRACWSQRLSIRHAGTRAGQDFAHDAAEFGTAKGLFAQTGQRAMHRQHLHRQFHRRVAGQQQRSTGRIVLPDRLQHAQSVLVAVILASQRQVDHRQSIGPEPDAGRGRGEAVSQVDFQSLVGQDFDQNLLPGRVVLDHQRPMYLRRRGESHGQLSFPRWPPAAAAG